METQKKGFFQEYKWLLVGVLVVLIMWSQRGLLVQWAQLGLASVRSATYERVNEAQVLQTYQHQNGIEIVVVAAPNAQTEDYQIAFDYAEYLLKVDLHGKCNFAKGWGIFDFSYTTLSIKIASQDGRTGEASCQAVEGNDNNLKAVPSVAEIRINPETFRQLFKTDESFYPDFIWERYEKFPDDEKLAVSVSGTGTHELAHIQTTPCRWHGNEICTTYLGHWAVAQRLGFSLEEFNRLVYTDPSARFYIEAWTRSTMEDFIPSEEQTQAFPIFEYR